MLDAIIKFVVYGIRFIFGSAVKYIVAPVFTFAASAALFVLDLAFRFVISPVFTVFKTILHYMFEGVSPLSKILAIILLVPAIAIFAGIMEALDLDDTNLYAGVTILGAGLFILNIISLIVG